MARYELPGVGYGEDGGKLGFRFEDESLDGGGGGGGTESSVEEGDGTVGGG